MRFLNYMKKLKRKRLSEKRKNAKKVYREDEKVKKVARC